MAGEANELSSVQMTEFLKEAQVMAKFDHPNVISLLAVCLRYANALYRHNKHLQACNDTPAINDRNCINLLLHFYYDELDMSGHQSMACSVVNPGVVHW